MIATRRTATGLPVPAHQLFKGRVTTSDIRKHGSYAAARLAKDKECQHG